MSAVSKAELAERHQGRVLVTLWDGEGEIDAAVTVEVPRGHVKDAQHVSPDPEFLGEPAGPVAEEHEHARGQIRGAIAV